MINKLIFLILKMRSALILLAGVYIFLVLFNEKNIFFLNGGTKDLVVKQKNYDCSYSKLACSFQSANKFYAGCYPVFSHILYNRTDCPRLKNSFLTGFVRR
jgi:hypothetical protein